MQKKIVDVTKALVIAYAITAILLLAVAYGIYKFDITNTQASIGIMAIYAIAVFVGALLLAGSAKTRRLFWGVGFALLYLLILCVGSFLMSQGKNIQMNLCVRAVVICLAAGIVGAVFSPA